VTRSRTWIAHLDVMWWFKIKNEFFSSVIGLGDRAHNLLLQIESDGSCQNKFSVCVRVEFLCATMWHVYVLTKHLMN